MILSPQVKSSLFTAIFTIILWYVLSAFIYQSWSLAQNASKSQPFTISGTGTVTAQPDLAQISFSVTKTNPTLKDAQNEANTSTNNIVADLQKIGIDKKDIKTSNYSSYPNYNNNDNSQPNGLMMPIRPPQTSQTIISYTVSENVDINVHDSTKVNNVIDAITKDGAENISGPNYVFSDATQKSLQDKARLQAITDAKQKAQTMANAAGIRLGKMVNIQESNNGIMPYPVMMKASGTTSASDGVPTQINPGENTVTDSVTLSYETW